MKTRWHPIRSVDRGSLLVDPYYEWTLVTKYVYYGEPKLVPMLAELHPGKEDEFAQLLPQTGAVKEERSRSRRRTRERRARPSDFVSMLHPRREVESLYRQAGEQGLARRFQISRALKLGGRNKGSASVKAPEAGTEAQKAAQTAEGSNRPRVVVTGIIDDGIAFANERFRNPDGTTRVEWFWDQSEPSSNPPQPWNYGRQFSKGDIDNLLSTCTHAGLVDEDEIYQRSGLTDQALSGHKPLAWRAAHGTVVADVACGAGKNDPRPTNPIIGVQLPVATTADTSGASLAKQVYDAIEYILDRSDLIALANGETVPIVINLSYGLFAGPHDGTSILETAIDKFIASRIPEGKTKSQLCVVIPSGNAYLSRCHAYVCLDASAERTLTWRVLPDDRTESFLEIWLPAGDEAGSPPNIDITVTTPNGDAVLVPVGHPGHQWPVGGPTVCSVARYAAAQTGSRELIMISLAPTGSPEGLLPLAPSGNWKVTLKNTASVAVHGINAWIQRDDTPYGYPRRGRQSYFDDPEYQRFDAGGREIEDDNVPANRSHVKRSGSLNAIATGVGPIVVGGYRRSDRRCAKYTASGPVVHPPGRGAPSDDGPDALTVSEDSVACEGVLGAGSRSGSTVAMNGTSVAAPRIARELVDYMIRKPKKLGSRKKVFQWARDAEGNPYQGPPQVRAGGGRLPLPPIAPSTPIKRVDEP